MGDGQSASGEGYAYYPGIYSIGCDVQIVQVGVPDSETWVHVDGNCAVIGGALSFSVERKSFVYQGSTPSNATTITNFSPQQRTLVMPTRDSNVNGNPYHLQYFGFDPDVVPDNSQAPQAVVSVESHLQPPGTSFQWTNSAPTKFAVTLGGGSADPSLKGKAIGAGSTEISCVFTLNFTGKHGHSASASASDITTLVPEPGTPLVMRVRKVNIHTPTNTVKQEDRPFRYSNYFNQLNQLTPGYAYSGSVSKIKLVSQMDVEMPGVWIQERFVGGPNVTFPVPSWFTTNRNSDFPYGVWSTSGLEDSLNLGRFYWDYLYIAMPISDSRCVPWTFRHEYWVATRSTTQGGIYVGTWEIYYHLAARNGHVTNASHTKVP